jgi:hypothetical protein
VQGARGRTLTIGARMAARFNTKFRKELFNISPQARSLETFQCPETSDSLRTPLAGGALAPVTNCRLTTFRNRCDHSPPPVNGNGLWAANAGRNQNAGCNGFRRH